MTFKYRLIYGLLVMFFVPVTVALVGAELIVRNTSRAGYVTPQILRDRSLQYSPALFARHVFPQREVKAYVEDSDNRTEYHINERGYRGHNFSVPKPAEKIRIIFYGGSAVFDQNLPEGQDWPHRVEAILRLNGFPQVEVVNAGIPGHASFDCFGRLFAEGHRFDPDYVISYNAWNDIKYFRSDQPLLRQFQPFNERADPRLNYQGRFDRFLGERSQLYVRVRARYYDWKLQIGSEGRVPQGDLSSEISKEALRQFALTQTMFVDLAREIGAVPVLMIEARLTADDNTESQKSRIGYDYVMLNHETLLKAYEGIEGTLRRISSEKGIVLLDFSKDLNGKDDFFSDHVHLTQKGSEALANMTAAKLMEHLRVRTQATDYRQGRVGLR